MKYVCITMVHDGRPDAPASTPTGPMTESYWVEGYLQREVEVGEPLLVARKVRNGVPAAGLFMTSNVVCWDGECATTVSGSVYRIEEVAERFSEPKMLAESK